jgi:hypothetical protein
VFAAGFMMTMIMTTQLYLVLFAPLPILWFLVLDRLRHKHDLVYSGLLFALGAITGVAIVGLLSLHIGGDFDYYQPQIEAARSIPAQRLYPPGYAWLREAGWLVLPALGVLVGTGLFIRAAVLAIKRRGRFWQIGADNLTIAVAALMPIGVAAVFFYRLFVVGTPELQAFFYTSYFVPFIFLAFGATLTLIMSRVSQRTRLVMAVSGMIVLLLPFAFELLRPNEQCYAPSCTLGEEGVMMLAVAALLVASLSLRRIEPAIGGWLLLAALNIGAADARFVRFENNERLYNEFVQVVRIHERLNQYDQDGKLKFWLSTYDDPNYMISSGVLSMHLYGYRFIAQDYPTFGALTGSPKYKPLVGDKIAVLTSQANVAKNAVETIEKEGFYTSVLGSLQLYARCWHHTSAYSDTAHRAVDRYAAQANFRPRHVGGTAGGRKHQARAVRRRGNYSEDGLDPGRRTTPAGRNQDYICRALGLCQCGGRGRRRHSGHRHGQPRRDGMVLDRTDPAGPRQGLRAATADRFLGRHRGPHRNQLGHRPSELGNNHKGDCLRQSGRGRHAAAGTLIVRNHAVRARACQSP